MHRPMALLPCETGVWKPDAKRTIPRGKHHNTGNSQTCINSMYEMKCARSIKAEGASPCGLGGMQSRNVQTAPDATCTVPRDKATHEMRLEHTFY